MVGTVAGDRCETLARLIARLSDDIRRLTREIPLCEGRLLELEMTDPANRAATARIVEEIRLAQEQLMHAESDLVQLEDIFKADCRPPPDG